MINKQEIDEMAREFEINTSNVQRDYVFGWILFALFTVSDLKSYIFLKGGNALRKGYFKNTRFSYDLDFGIPHDISQSVLLEEINKICDFIQDKAGVVFVKDENRLEEKFAASEAPIPGLKVYEGRVYFKDFYGHQDSIKIKISLDVTRFDKTILPIQDLELIHPYSDAEQVKCTVRCMRLEEIIATKLKCLLQRQHVPDLFDYVHSVKLLGGDLNREEVVKVLVQKTIFGKNPLVLKNILSKTSFDYFRACWYKSLICARQLIFDINEAIEAFVADLDGLFSIYQDNGYGQFAYFSPELRLPIMNAGRSQTLLKMRYKGSDRIIEPYSLKYLQKKDGSEREYFYAYNREGGTSQPGIRCFVADGIESIENTEEKFEPRYIIELCKAGEKPENPYLFDPNKPMLSPARLKRRTSKSVGYSGPKYIYQCSYCGKKFSKKSYSGSIGKHKNKSGYQCPGTYGYYVDTRY